MSKDTVRGDDRKSFGEIAEEIFGRTDRDRYPIRDDTTANTIANSTVEATTATSAKATTVTSAKATTATSAKASATVSVKTTTDTKPATPARDEAYEKWVRDAIPKHNAKVIADTRLAERYLEMFAETGDERYVQEYMELLRRAGLSGRR